MPAIIFLDVELSDRKAVLEKFPSAKFADGRIRETELIQTCHDAEIISTFITTQFTRSIIENLPSLKLLATRSVGYDHIDLDACMARGITVTNVPDYGSHVIAEHVFALLLSTIRHVHAGDEKVRSGVFDYHGLRGMALRGKTIGIVGTGKIGRKVAKIANGFGMKIVAVDQYRNTEIEDLLGVRYVKLHELLQKSDIVTLHMPGTKDTEHMINADTFALMKDGAILVNTARGSLIDSHALLAALNKGKLAWALLDVLEHEQNFEENKELVSHPRIVTTPHIAFYADDSMHNIYLDCFHSIDQWLTGAVPDHRVRPLQVVLDSHAIKKDTSAGA